MCGHLHVLAALALEKEPHCTYWGFGQTPKPFWTLCRREKSVPPAGINNHSSLAIQQ